MEGGLPSMQPSSESVQSRVRIGPRPDWAAICNFDVNFKGRSGAPVTHLLINRQIHADRRQTLLHFARRLESMQAVQHESQWRLPFDPATQLITIHWIKIRRGAEEFDHANLQQIRILQREEGLDGQILDGWWTILFLLEDVRSGDVMESYYSIEETPRLLPEYCTSFFALPPGGSVGAFGFSVRFAASRAMQWRSSSKNLLPIEHQASGESILEWKGEKLTIDDLEDGAPLWHQAFPWVQISDCPNWNVVAAAVASAWETDLDEAGLATMANEIISSAPDQLTQVEKAIRLVQDEYRYLSVNLELGGQIPASPAIVARRRFGDCKDLSYLLACLLKQIGIIARPVLVHSTLRKSVADFLPMLGSFNHVIVEFHLQGQTRWVDATLRKQGGNALSHFIPDFGAGLPVDRAATGLIRPPHVQPTAGVYEIIESLLLDTTGAASLLAINLRLTGWHAELVRNQLEALGVEKFAEERLRIQSSRYGNAKRVGQMQYRDSRTKNVFLVTEVFEVNGFFAEHRKPGMCAFNIPVSPVLESLRLPNSTSRKSPLALPYRSNIVHTLEIESVSLQPMAAPRFSIDSPHLRFNRRQKSLHKYWSVTLQLETWADAVAPSAYPEHRKLVERIVAVKAKQDSFCS